MKKREIFEENHLVFPEKMFYEDNMFLKAQNIYKIDDEIILFGLPAGTEKIDLKVTAKNGA